MYLREKKLKLLRIRNVLLTVFAVIELLGRGYYIVSEFVYYRDDPESAWGAVDMKSSLIMVPLFVLLLILLARSRYHIGNAVFFSRCFEGDLDGVLPVADLAAVTGMTVPQAERETALCIRRYMKSCTLRAENDGSRSVVLESKKIRCQCQSCGAEIEKSIYFTGTCSYCGSSDLTARVLSGDQFLSISSEAQQGRNNPAFYTAKNLPLKKALFATLFVLGASLALIALLYTGSELSHYFDKAYQQKILLDPDKHLFSYELIRAHILDNMLFGIALVLVLTPLAWLRLRKTVSIRTAQESAGYFARYSKPYVPVEQIPDMGVVATSRSKMKSVRRALRHGYLRNCSFEMHGGRLTAALAKKIVRNQCPGCGAPITGAVDENYTCSYCGREIMGVVVKK